MYEFKDNLRTDIFFRFDKQLIKTKQWARLPMASKSIFPVIASHCNINGVAYPSQETIGIKAGCTPKTVREGLKGLISLYGFEIKSKVTSRGHRQKTYKITMPPKERGRCFFFNKCIVDGGHWCQLPQVSQAVYPVLRAFCFFDDGTYCYDEDLEYDRNVQEIIDDGEFANRPYDLFTGEKDVIAEYAGIGERSTYNAIDALFKCGLIETADMVDNLQGYKVYIVPPRYFKREYLNRQIAARIAKFTY